MKIVAQVDEHARLISFISDEPIQLRQVYIDPKDLATDSDTAPITYGPILESRVEVEFVDSIFSLCDDSVIFQEEKNQN